MKRLFFFKNISVLLMIVFVLFTLYACGGSSGAGNNSPVARITAPSDGSIYSAGEEIQFEGNCHDSEDGALSGASLVWTSDLDGRIGTGETFASSTLSSGGHQITLTCTDYPDLHRRQRGCWRGYRTHVAAG